ncbi:thermonuclease family protein [Candidatus Viridilinea mediisalina]|uniref:Nuclease n=1 Tax=Candidatus Viridilinea mediisalina TaxID=2024553 RepID=A0A2A6RHK3_9CHLR|nr:thermonuclease family protein [Candidatus Viridilinea mediisalina]PDW02423.1 nuclease [Candidatus Viridilinea mediisalina]
MLRHALVTLTLLVLVACGKSNVAPTPPMAYPSMPTDLPRAEMVRVVDGDTIQVRINGQLERVRLIGIDTPEAVDPRRPVECFGREASEHARQLLNVPYVRLEADPSQDSRDRFGRMLRYVWLEDGRMVNLEQLLGGYAFEYTFRVPYAYQAEFKAAERIAREDQVGLWAPETCGGENFPLE